MCKESRLSDYSNRIYLTNMNSFKAIDCLRKLKIAFEVQTA